MNVLNTSFLVIVALIITSYIIGSIPSGFILGQVFRKTDIRQHGSGNVGATNVFRVLGWRLGIIALMFDIFKGLIVVIIARNLFPDNSLIIVGAGLTAILGHIFSLFLRFKGGKGVATSAGVFIALTPLASGIALLVFLTVLLATKYVSMSSITASLALAISQFIIVWKSSFINIETLLITLLVAFFIIYKHKSNIKRLLNGTENRLSFGSKDNQQYRNKE